MLSNSFFFLFLDQLLTTDAQKRKPEESTGDDSDAKKAKLDLSVDERVLMVTIPYHNIPYEEQVRTM